MAPFSLQPIPPPNRGPQSISDFIQRMNAEASGFRGLNQDDLRKQIDAAKNKGEGDVEMEDIGDVDDPSTKNKELFAAREDLLRNINAAHRTATTTLDLISLLLTKEIPNAAGATLNNGLRNLVSIGTLGATALAAPTTLTQSRIPDNKMAAIGMRLQAVTKAANSLESAAKRLETEISLETTYWNEVRATSERGWSVFRHPDEPHTMGVKFGFSNAAPDFKANSIAPMRRAEDGTVRLEHGKMTGVSKRIQVTISQGDKVVGRSRLPQPLQDDVKEARDTVFAEELWHELNRESRTLLAHSVRLRDDAVTYTDDTNRTISFRLVTLDDDTAPANPEPEDGEADRINDTLHLLLIQAHRQNELKRSEQSNPGPNRGTTAVYFLLLPILTTHAHEQTMQKCITFLITLCNLLRAAGISTPPSFTLTEPPLTGSSTESLANTLLNPSAAEFDLTLTPNARLRITARPSPAFSTRFQVFLLPPSGADNSNIKANPLSWSYPPASHDPARPPPTTATAAATADILYDSPAKLFQYLCAAVPRALAWYFYGTVLRELESTSHAAGAKWVVDTFGTALVDDNGESGVSFGFGHAGSAGKDNDEVDVSRLGDMELTAEGDFVQDGKKTARVWRWGLGRGEGTAEDVVRFVIAHASVY